MNWIVFSAAVVFLIEFSELKAILKRIAEALENMRRISHD